MSVLGWIAIIFLCLYVMFFGILWMNYFLTDHKKYKAMHPKTKGKRKD